MLEVKTVVPVSEKTLFEKIKETGSHAIIYGLGSVLQSALSFLFIPLYTHYYTTDMYGALSLINLCGVLAGSFFYLGASSALARSYYDYQDKYQRKQVVSTSVYITFFGALLQVILGLMLSKTISEQLFRTDNYSTHIRLILISSAITFLNNAFYVVLRFNKLSKHVIILNGMALILTTALTVYFLIVLKLGVMAPILGGLINAAVLFVILLYLIRENLVPDYSKHELKIQLAYGFQAIAIAMAYYSFDWLNRFFINRYCSLSDVGIYSLGDQIGSAINILFIVPFSQIWAPMRMQYRNDGNADEFMGKMLTYYVVLGLISAVIISLYSKEVISIIAGHKEYADAYRVVPFVVMGSLIFGMVNFLEYGIYLARKVIYLACIFWFSSIVSFILNFIFVRRYGYMAAAEIFVICNLVAASLMFYISNRLYRIPFEGNRLALTGCIALLALTAGCSMSFGQIYCGILFKSAVTFMMFVLIFRHVLTTVEKKKAVNLFEEIFLWRRQEVRV